MFKNALASVAAAGLLIAPIAAQANTRADDSQVSLSVLGDPSARMGAGAFSAEGMAGSGISLAMIIAIFGSIAAFIVWLAEQEEDDGSPGTGG